jgi:quercetin dioxygenase-like cupin family protein
MVRFAARFARKRRESMKIKSFLAVAVCLLAASAVFGQSAMGAAGTPTIWPAADLKWAPISPENPTVMIADLWGDHTKGPYGAVIKFPAGFEAPAHTHTADFRIVVISGTFIHTAQGKPAANLTAGSYLFQPGGNYVHTTACGKASECMIFTEGNGAFDLKPVEAKK